MSQEDPPVRPASLPGGCGDGDGDGMDAPPAQAGSRFRAPPLPPPWTVPYGPPPQPHRRRRRLLRTALITGGVVLGGFVSLGILGAVLGSHPAATTVPAAASSVSPLVPASPGQAAVPGVPPAPPPSWSARDTAVKGCRDLASWENGTAGTTFNKDPKSQAIIDESAGTQFAADLRAWVDDLDNVDVQSAQADAATVGDDCLAVGVTTGLGA